MNILLGNIFHQDLLEPQLIKLTAFKVRLNSFRSVELTGISSSKFQKCLRLCIFLLACIADVSIYFFIITYFTQWVFVTDTEYEYRVVREGSKSLFTCSRHHLFIVLKLHIIGCLYEINDIKSVFTDGTQSNLRLENVLLTFIDCY